MDVVRTSEELGRRSDAESRRQTNGDDKVEDNVGCLKKGRQRAQKRCVIMYPTKNAGKFQSKGECRWIGPALATRDGSRLVCGCDQQYW